MGLELTGSLGASPRSEGTQVPNELPGCQFMVDQAAAEARLGGDCRPGETLIERM